jgi:aryl-alcohol dehydrogenase-like predicted oxidoreductase
MLIGRALQGRRDRVLLSVKFGGMRSPDGNWIGFDGRPAAVKNFAAYSLKRLGTDHIDIYRPSRLDPTVPIEETVGAIGDLITAGYVRFAGLSEVGAETIRRAHAVRPISDLQIEYSLISRGPETSIFPALEELGIGVTARTRKQLAESLGALDVRLSPAEIAALEEAVPASAVAGTRYNERQMRNLDSERR